MKIETQNIFFIADFHLSHKNVIRFDNRPFSNLDEMHETLMNNWNSVVKSNDIVYYLGDLTFGRMDYAKWFVHQLNGDIHFILGNHDRYHQISRLGRFSTIDKEQQISIKDTNIKGGYQHIHMHHHPILSWNGNHHGSIHLHGHVHQKMTLNKDYDWYYKRKVIDVGCNGIDYTPISYGQVMNIMKTRNTAPVGEQL